MTVRRTKGRAANHYKTTRQGVSPELAEELRVFFEESVTDYPFTRKGLAAEDGSHEFQRLVGKEADHLSGLLVARRRTFPFVGALFGYHLWRHSISAYAKKQKLSEAESMALLAHASKAMYHHYGGHEEEDLLRIADQLKLTPESIN